VVGSSQRNHAAVLSKKDKQLPWVHDYRQRGDSTTGAANLAAAGRSAGAHSPVSPRGTAWWLIYQAVEYSISSGTLIGDVSIAPFLCCSVLPKNNAGKIRAILWMRQSLFPAMQGWR